ncbi:MAG: spore germination protein [Desulfitobacteriaceae bacterium]|nr:spore germination protein [Desulfitobacteriaceae bacterium]MDI6913790.1 spore germination protein [Desulfitobacteriaceae bacterium]
MMRIITSIWNSLKKNKGSKINVINNTGKTVIPLTPSLPTNLSLLKERFQDSPDVVFREFTVGFEPYPKALLVYINGLISSDVISTTILKPLMFESLSEQYMLKKFQQISLLDFIQECAVPNSKVTKVNSLPDLIDGILSGNTAFVLDGFPTALVMDTKGWEARGVDEPDTEAVVRGPREGFTESIGVNTALLRRKIKDENLRFESLNLGRRSKTAVYIAYLQGVVNEKIVAETKSRLQRIDIDAILETGYIEQLIEDAPTSIFPTVGNTEKPDILAAKLLEGRVGIFVDGTPFVLTVPHLLIEAVQSPEDYYSRPYYATVIRLLRFIALGLATLLPSTYIALQSFHPEMIPTPLLISMAGAREGIPFPSYMEALVMGVIFEILREAGIRMPRPIGQAVSIVGALVLGQAAVEAGLISNAMVIVVALTAICGFVVSSIADAIALLRLFLLLCSTSFGFFGLLMGLLFVYIHLLKLRSFGIPYLTPIAPGNLNDLKDVFIRAPFWSLLTRPQLLGQKNVVRQKPTKPSPENSRE